MRRNRALDQFHTYTRALLIEAGSDRIAPPVAVGRTWRQRWRSPQVAFATLGFLVFGNIGMAAAANSAVPGDVLYPVDLGYEYMVGLLGGDAGGAEERLDEASVLIERGDYERAIDAIGTAADEFDAEAGATISDLNDRLQHVDGDNTNPEGLRSATVALLMTVQEMVDGEVELDLTIWKDAINSGVKAVADKAQGESPTPPGQDDTFVPPGQDDESTPPGLIDKPTPPGQDDTSVPPGQDDESTPPGLIDKPTPPGQDDTFVPPGQDDESTPPGLIDKPTPPGHNEAFSPPGRDRESKLSGRSGPRGQRSNRQSR